MMKRTYALILAGAATALIGGLIYAVLVATHLAEPAADTIHGPTLRRLWATSAVVLAVTAAVVGALALARPAGRYGTVYGRCGAVLAGVTAAVNGALVLSVADGGPGTGNGVVGGAAALVLGLLAAFLGGLAVVRARNSGRPLGA